MSNFSCHSYYQFFAVCVLVGVTWQHNLVCSIYSDIHHHNQSMLQWGGNLALHPTCTAHYIKSTSVGTSQVYPHCLLFMNCWLQQSILGYIQSFTK